MYQSTYSIELLAKNWHFGNFMDFYNSGYRKEQLQSGYTSVIVLSMYLSSNICQVLLMSIAKRALIKRSWNINAIFLRCHTAPPTVPKKL